MKKFWSLIENFRILSYFYLVILIFTVFSFAKAMEQPDDGSDKSNRTHIIDKLRITMSAVAKNLKQLPRRDETILVIGPPESGKSTLLNCLAEEESAGKTIMPKPGLGPLEETNGKAIKIPGLKFDSATGLLSLECSVMDDKDDIIHILRAFIIDQLAINPYHVILTLPDSMFKQTYSDSDLLAILTLVQRVRPGVLVVNNKSNDLLGDKEKVQKLIETSELFLQRAPSHSELTETVMFMRRLLDLDQVYSFTTKPDLFSSLSSFFTWGGQNSKQHHEAAYKKWQVDKVKLLHYLKLKKEKIVPYFYSLNPSASTPAQRLVESVRTNLEQFVSQMFRDIRQEYQQALQMSYDISQHLDAGQADIEARSWGRYHMIAQSWSMFLREFLGVINSCNNNKLAPELTNYIGKLKEQSLTIPSTHNALHKKMAELTNLSHMSSFLANLLHSLKVQVPARDIPSPSNMLRLYLPIVIGELDECLSMFSSIQACTQNIVKEIAITENIAKDISRKMSNMADIFRSEDISERFSQGVTGAGFFGKTAAAVTKGTQTAQSMKRDDTELYYLLEEEKAHKQVLEGYKTQRRNLKHQLQSLFQETDLNISIERLTQTIEDSERLIETQLQREPFDTTRVLVLGTTGSGKTTLTHSLAKKRLFARRGVGTFHLEPLEEDYLPGFVIGHSLSSATARPCFWYDEQEKLSYWDCPGFMDSRGIFQEITNAFAIDQLFREPSRIKVLLAMQASDFEGMRGMDAINDLRRLTRLFFDPKALMQSICLIVTKKLEGGFTSHQMVAGLLDDAQAELRVQSRDPTELESLEWVVDLLSFINAHPDRIFTFPRPIEEGAFVSFESDQVRLLKCLKKDSAVNPLHSISFDDNVISFILEIMRKYGSFEENILNFTRVIQSQYKGKKLDVLILWKGIINKLLTKVSEIEKLDTLVLESNSLLPDRGATEPFLTMSRSMIRSQRYIDFAKKTIPGNIPLMRKVGDILAPRLSYMLSELEVLISNETLLKKQREEIDQLTCEVQAGKTAKEEAEIRIQEIQSASLQASLKLADVQRQLDVVRQETEASAKRAVSEELSRFSKELEELKQKIKSPCNHENELNDLRRQLREERERADAAETRLQQLFAPRPMFMMRGFPPGGY